jgi:predicted transcriptional regulator of viral defense system
MIVPLEAGKLGSQSYTIHSFVIASHLVDPYYISHWSALNYYGYTEQTPPAVYISTTKPRNRKHILDTEFIFVAVTKRKMFSINVITIEDHSVKISSPEKTIADCLDHPEHCGGILEVAKALYFEHESLDLGEILQAAERMGNKTIIKRLGYLLETFGYKRYMDFFDDHELSKGYSTLDPGKPKNGKINEKWRLLINTKVDPGEWTR